MVVGALLLWPLFAPPLLPLVPLSLALGPLFEPMFGPMFECMYEPEPPSNVSKPLTITCLADGRVLTESTPGGRRPVVFSEDQGFSVLADSSPTASRATLQHMLRKSFLPGGQMTPDYYRYTTWRVAQRFVSSTSSVFGTQALLLALGVKQRQQLGISAATMWVLKDALGKFSRVFWASRNGRRFDSDAKKWRFRSALLYSLGNALEVVTYLLPSLFLLTAAVANALKQMALLTSSATRNAIYRSFARNSDNIGDITAKGEAQLAVVDLVGMLCGVSISHLIGASRPKILALFAALSACDLFCTFHEIRSIVFTALNFERAGIVLQRYLRGERGLSPYDTTFGERLLGSCPLSEDMFVPWSRLPREMGIEEVESGIAAFPEERFVLCLAAKLRPSYLERRQRNAFAIEAGPNRVPVLVLPRLLLREDADQSDVFRALIALHRIRHRMSSEAAVSSIETTNDRNSSSQLEALGFGREALHAHKLEAAAFLREQTESIYSTLGEAGWDTDRFMFGNISSRVTW